MPCLQQRKPKAFPYHKCPKDPSTEDLPRPASPSGSVCARSDLWSSVEMQTSTMSMKGRLGGNMTWDRPLRELTGVPEDRDEAEEVDPEPWDEDWAVPLDTGRGDTVNTRISLA